MTNVRAVAGTVYVHLGALNAVAVVRSTVDAMADAVDNSGASVADLNALAAVLREAVREGVSVGLAAQRVDAQTPMFGAVGHFLNANQGLLALIALVITVLSLMQQDRAADEQYDPPPNVTVQIEPHDRAEVARIVEECLQEQEQGNGEHP